MLKVIYILLLFFIPNFIYTNTLNHIERQIKDNYINKYLKKCDVPANLSIKEILKLKAIMASEAILKQNNYDFLQKSHRRNLKYKIVTIYQEEPSIIKTLVNKYKKYDLDKNLINCYKSYILNHNNKKLNYIDFVQYQTVNYYFLIKALEQEDWPIVKFLLFTYISNNNNTNNIIQKLFEDKLLIGLTISDKKKIARIFFKYGIKIPTNIILDNFTENMALDNLTNQILDLDKINLNDLKNTRTAPNQHNFTIERTINSANIFKLNKLDFENITYLKIPLNTKNLIIKLKEIEESLNLISKSQTLKEITLNNFDNFSNLRKLNNYNYNINKILQYWRLKSYISYMLTQAAKPNIPPEIASFISSYLSPEDLQTIIKSYSFTNFIKYALKIWWNTKIN